ncbi:hypothetical protein KAR91_19595 [Candidatus Pacearchaeota archaeon]|nr:hypothetical protein [Candidatus Pacearchaeota archaeon]
MKTIGPGTREFDVVIQDSTSPLFQYFLMNEQKTDITLTSPASVGDEVINVSAGHGFSGVAGEQVTLFENNRYTQLRVTGVATDAISIEEPITIAFTTDAIVIRGNVLMNVDGSGADVEFICTLRDFIIPIDISKIIITMQHGTNVPDDGNFGGLPALAKGVFFKKENDSTFSLGNYIQNQDFKDTGGVVEYTSKAPAGTNATNIVFDIKTTFGQVIRIHPAANDIIKGIIRDNISPGAGMAKMTTSLIGSYTEGEA